MLREMTSQTRLDLITLQSWTHEVCLMVEASKRRKGCTSPASGFVLFRRICNFWGCCSLAYSSSHQVFKTLQSCRGVSFSLYHLFVCLLYCSHELSLIQKLNSKMAFRRKQHICSSFSTLQFKGSVPPVFPYLLILLLTALLHRSHHRQLLDSRLLFCAANYWQDCVPVWTLSDVGPRRCVVGRAG